jgi:hypothetical protein
MLARAEAGPASGRFQNQGFGVMGFRKNLLHSGWCVLLYPHGIDALEQRIEKGLWIVPVEKLSAKPLQCFVLGVFR